MRVKAKRKIFWLSMLSVLIVAFISFLTPLAFSAYLEEHIFSDLWLILTNTGDKYGTIVSVIVVGILIGFQQESSRKKLLTSFLFILPFLLVLQFTAFLNERILKEELDVPRPSFLHLEKLEVVSTDSVYSFDNTADRSEYVRKKLGQTVSASKTQDFDQDVLEHWADTTGYSLPSGHSVNAFVVATVFSFILFFILPGKLQILYPIPLVWAILIGLSRVALGVHSALDVTLGAFVGSLVGLTVLQIPVIRQWVDK